MRGIKVGSAFGIPIRLNWTFLLVLPLFAFLIGTDVAGITSVINGTFGSAIAASALEGAYRPWLLGLAAALGLFVGVLLHELGHSLVAIRYGYGIDSITLWLLGGLANFAEMPENWKHEFRIAVAGPIVSVAVGVACYAAFLVVPESLHALRFVLGYLATLNVVLAAFNMLPAFPMDGGRVLRALLARTQPHATATQQAAEIGKVFAFLLGILGLFSSWFLVVLAFFIYIAASGEAQQTTMKAAFEGVSVGDVMTGQAGLHTVSPDTSVAALTDRMFRERHTGYPVIDRERLVGMVTLDDASDVTEVERDAYRVEDVMTRDVLTVTPDTPAMTALERMQSGGVGRLPVVDADGEVTGIISRTDLMTAFDIIQTGGTPASPSERALDGADGTGPRLGT